MARYKKNAALFADARRSLLGHLGTALWSVALYLFLTFSLTRIPASFSLEGRAAALAVSVIAEYATALFGSLFGIGLASVFLNLQYGQPASVRELFSCLREDPDRSVRVRAYVTFGGQLCLLPLQILTAFSTGGALQDSLPLYCAVGGACIAAHTVWSLTYAIANYLLLDFPQMPPRQVLHASRSMMRGNRVRLFFLLLRLLPMHLLGIFSLGLANLYAGCCQHACAAAFYKDLMASARLSD